MRYRIVCGGEGLPPLEAQRAQVADSAYDIELDGQIVTHAGGRTLRRHLGQLQAGDEILFWGLEVLQLSTVELLPVLLRFLDLGVAITLTRGSSPETLRGEADAPRALALLAEHEARRPTRASAFRRPSRSERALSPYQLGYARKLLRQGDSLRAVSMLFQVSPEDLNDLMGRPTCAAEG